jgi:hypothetical protein
MFLNEDIIPITFMGGTGGNFLCHFIVSAKRNIKTILELSEHGNAHQNCLKDCFSPPYGIPQPDDEKIKFILTQPPHCGSEKPYYTSSHITDINLINSNFKRSIRITYDLDDILEISTVFYGKFAVDTYDPIKHNHMKQTPEYIKRVVKSWQPKFTKIENMPDVLFISWKELFKGNVEELITKISIFTGIDSTNFSRESLIHWRNKTQYCIDKFTDI